MKASERASVALDRVCKWRTILAGRVWGTSAKTPQAKGRTDIFERLIILRVELNALTALLLESGVIPEERYLNAIERAAIDLDNAYAEHFPGIRSSATGMVIGPEAIKTMEGWPK